MIVGATKSGDIVAWKTKEIFKEVERRLQSDEERGESEDEEMMVNNPEQISTENRGKTGSSQVESL